MANPSSIAAILALFSLVLVPSADCMPLDQEVLRPLHLWHELGKDVYEVRKELRKAEIIPTVMDDFLPRFTLEATWSPSHVAQLGNTLSPSDLQDAPSITLTQASSPPSSRAPALDGCIFHANTTYALVLTDPDAPSRSDPKWAEFCHWIAAGVPSSSSSETGCARLELASLKDVVSYRPPGPPPKTGKHRYVFLAFAPANGTTAPLDLTKPEERKRWGSDKEETYGAREWASENGLIPIGANFIYAQNKKQ